MNAARTAVRLYAASSSSSATATSSARIGGNSNAKPGWSRAVSDAEQIVDYPSSFLNLRWLLNDELTNVQRWLVSSKHPLLETAKGLLYDRRNNTQAWGLIVLLLSKVAGHLNVECSAEENESGVLLTQRSLADISEMIRTSYLMHNSLINIYPGLISEPVTRKDLSFGNKMALLGGDYMLANSYNELSKLRNPNVMELMSSALRDLSEAEFMGRRDSQNIPLPSPFEPLDRQLDLSCRRRLDPFQPSGPPDSIPLTPAVLDWTVRNVLSAGSLLGKSCRSALLLAGHGEHTQTRGFLFGKHLSLAWQAYLDLEPFLSSPLYPSEKAFNLTSAPVMFHLEYDPSLFEEINKGVHSVHDIDYTKVHNIVMNGPGIDYTKQLQKEHSQKAIDILNIFKESDTRTALSNIILAMDYE